MARQHISIGTIANDDTGDSLRVGGDKANDNFIELYSMFDVWPGNFNYWPLGGAADLTSTLTIDGNDHDLIFGDPNSLDEFQVNVNNNLHLHAYDGVDHTHVSLHPDEFSVLSDTTEIVLTPILFHTIVNEGANSSSFDLSATELEILLNGGDSYFVIDSNSTNLVTDQYLQVMTSDLLELQGNTGVSIISDDGVDSSTLSLTPLGLDIEHFAGGTTDVLSTWQINGASGVDLRIGTGFGSTRFSDVQFGVVDSFSINVNATNSLTVLPTLTTVSAPFQLASYTVATLPAAASYPRCLVWVSDETDGACEAISNGTNWIRTYDGTTVS